MKAFVNLVAERTFSNWLEGGVDRLDDLTWPAIIYDVPFGVLEKEIRNRFQSLFEDYVERLANPLTPMEK